MSKTTTIFKNEIFKEDLCDIDFFIGKYGHLGIYSSKIDVELVCYDKLDKSEISKEKFEKNNDDFLYFLNYSEIIPEFNFGFFYNNSLLLFSDLSQNFRKELREILLEINSDGSKRYFISEMITNFKNCIFLLSNNIAMANSIQKDIIDHFIQCYQNEIQYLERLDAKFLHQFYESMGIKHLVPSNTLDDKIEENTIKINESITNTKKEEIKEEIKEEVKDEKELLSLEETAKLLKVSSTTLWRWRKGGKIKTYGIGGKKYCKKSEINESLIHLN